MRDPTINLDEVEAAIAELVQFFKARRRWLQATSFNWSNVDVRARARLRIARFKPLMADDEYELLCALLDQPPPLPPRRQGRHQEGQYGPRNVTIRQAIKITTRRGFNPTRNPEQVKRKIESGCSLISAALGRLGLSFKESTIKRILYPRRRRVP
jgi:hypothetical protein